MALTTAAAREAVLRVGEVTAVEGRKIFILVDKKKNLSHLFLDGHILTNIAVNGFVEIRKGFLSIIGRVEGERIEEDSTFRDGSDMRERTQRIKRVLTVSLAGYIDERGAFSGGTKELPLVGNEAFLVTRDQLHRIHDLVRASEMSVTIATLYSDDFDVKLPVDGLFNSHIAVFGNTGSGKSNTVAYLYQEFVRALSARNPEAFARNARLVFFDFNGEYAAEACITPSKYVYNVTTRHAEGDKLPLPAAALLDPETLSILAEATEKTQKPFLKRATRYYQKIMNAADGDPESFLRNLLKKRIRQVLLMSDKQRVFHIFDYFRQILPDADGEGSPVDLMADLDWHNQTSTFKHTTSGRYLQTNPEVIEQTTLYNHAETLELSDNLLTNIIAFLYIQLIEDLIANRAQNEHIAPVINRLSGKRQDIERIFDFQHDAEFWRSNFIVVNLDQANLDMKKTIPLLLSKTLYAAHKRVGVDQTLNIIIDEAHNILSTQSFREAESWKDYRLETFEEIIKEGRKFGVFVTIASQRPSDISPTITSQAHNYFIHRLINEGDLKTIASAVSYIDRATEESIPTLPTGTCVFSGVASPMPLKINVKRLTGESQPQSHTREFAKIVPS